MESHSASFFLLACYFFLHLVRVCMRTQHTVRYLCLLGGHVMARTSCMFGWSSLQILLLHTWISPPQLLYIVRGWLYFLDAVMYWTWCGNWLLWWMPLYWRVLCRHIEWCSRGLSGYHVECWLLFRGRVLYLISWYCLLDYRGWTEQVFCSDNFFSGYRVVFQ